MRKIQIVVGHMEDTLREAEEYYHDYVIYKDECPKLATTALDMAKTHMDLYTKWHDVVVYLINEYKKDGKEVPDTMQKLWEYEHRKLVDEYNELRIKISLM